MIYLDNSATTKPYESVKNVYCKCLEEQYFNISSPYSAALGAEKLVAKAKKSVARALNCRDDELIFTSGGTECDNTALNLAPDNSTVIVSAVEHHAVLNCAEFLKRRNVKVVACPVNEKGIVEADTLCSLIDENTSLVSIMHVNNEVGSVNDIKTLCRAAKAKNNNILFHSDGVQAFMHICTDVKELGVDMYSTSAHKVHGTKGVGALYVNNRVKFHPFIYGGGQQENKRSGTVNVPGIVAFGEAVDVGSGEGGLNAAAVKEAYIRRLAEIKDTVIFQGEAPHILSVSFMGVKASSLQNALEGTVIIGKGSACTSRSSKVSHVLQALGMPLDRAEATVRLSFGAFNTVEEADVACAEITKAVSYLRKYKRK